MFRLIFEEPTMRCVFKLISGKGHVHKITATGEYRARLIMFVGNDLRSTVVGECFVTDIEAACHTLLAMEREATK